MLLIALVSFISLAFVLPMLRLWLRHRVVGLVIDKRDPFERVLGVGLFAMMAGMVGWALAVDRFTLWPAPAWLRAAGWCFIVAGLLLMITAQAQMGASWRIGIDRRPTELVTSGLYRAVRHPIYSALALVLFGVVGVTPHPAPLVFSVLAMVTVNLQTRREEQHMLEQHGERYRAWASGVGRFFPGVGRLR